MGDETLEKEIPRGRYFQGTLICPHCKTSGAHFREAGNEKCLSCGGLFKKPPPEEEL